MNKDIKTSRDNSGVPQSRVTEALRASQSASDMFDEAMSHFLGINRTDARCMDIIDRAGRVTAGHLATESGLTTGAVTIVIDRLEKAGYVRRFRDPDDRRKVWIETTDETKAIVQRVFGLYMVLGPQLLAGFSREQLEGIVRFLEGGSLIQRRMADLLRQHTDPHAKEMAERLLQARAFERDAQASIAGILAEIRELPPYEG